MSRLRVVHVTAAPEMVLRILLHDLRRLAQHCEHVIVCGEGRAVPRLRAEGLEVHTIPIERKVSPRADLLALRALTRILRSRKPHLVHSYAPKGGLLGQLAAAASRTPHRIHSCRGLLYTDDLSSRRRLLFSATDRLTNALADRTLFVSSADMRYSIDRRLCSPARAIHTGSGIDLTYFRRSPAVEDQARQLREEHGIALDAPLVLTVGRYVRDKGFLEIGAAVRSIQRAHPRVRFLWVAPVLEGEADALPDDHLVREGIADVVTRVGLVENMRPYYAAANLLVHPTYREGVPRALMEASAMRLPIAASSIPGCREVISSEALGFLFRARDPEDLARVVVNALNERDDATRRADLAHERAHEVFDQDRLSERIWKVYQEVLAT